MLKYELAELYLQLKKFEQVASAAPRPKWSSSLECGAFKEVSELILDNGFDSRDLQEVPLPHDFSLCSSESATGLDDGLPGYELCETEVPLTRSLRRYAAGDAAREGAAAGGARAPSPEQLQGSR
eukprot:5881152-Pleurochrysis_carterae.AAC.1